MARRFTDFLLCVVTPFIATAQTTKERSLNDASGGPDIIVEGVRENCRAWPSPPLPTAANGCQRLPDDPLDKVVVTPSFNDAPRLSAVVPIDGGKFAVESNAEQVTGPDFWQRTGVGVDEYVFRAPHDERPMCIGGNAPDQNTFAGFRRVLHAETLRGKRLRFTAWAATGGARNVTFFLAAGMKEGKLYNGGNTNNRPWSGSHGWTPVLLEIGPVPKGADHISYGFHLHGSGTVWIYEPKLEIIMDEPPAWSKGDFVIIGGNKH